MVLGAPALSASVQSRCKGREIADGLGYLWVSFEFAHPRQVLGAWDVGAKSAGSACAAGAGVGAAVGTRLSADCCQAVQREPSLVPRGRYCFLGFFL